ncbi:metal ABC transporter ATP-binding protein [Arthrobacter cheniae]|uniref:Metal ABC transporter ATP-binding protein n=1 Tax=Arthrobacter cheniae TaxID=1258888 RepID=A0A3A5M4W6_9MICC|nr:zinc ABC transporter ATP-binding protein AztA [Arthrobacter cheniae]RJT79044.1 metal ABC transporter ATP-binding protein [Arthrobacter cheniae]
MSLIRTSSARSAPRPGAADPGVLTLTDVWFDHDGVDALCGISLSIQPGAVTAIAGPNGSGKSTVLAVLAGLLNPRSGMVSVPPRVRRALVVQRSEVPDSMPLTVRDAVTMGRWPTAGMVRCLRAQDHQIIDGCIGLVGLDGYQDRLLSALSGGQRQRAFLAQGLAQRADIVLLDEPTTGLDAVTRGVVADVLLTERARGATMICVTHDDVALTAADHVIRLEGGRVAPAEVALTEA